MDRFLLFQQELDNLMFKFSDLGEETIAEELEFFTEHYKKRKGLIT